MNENNLDLTTASADGKRQSPRERIIVHLRDLIRSGHLMPGARLPSTQALAAQWQIQQTTVQYALAHLTREGLLDRRPRLGTYVRRTDATITRAAIYLPEDIWADPARSFLQSVCGAITEALKERGIMGHVVVNPSGGEREEPWDDLIKEAERRKFQVLIGLVFNNNPIKWLNKLPLPTAFLTEASIPNRVVSDYLQFFSESMNVLHAQGCRSVGLITSVPLTPTRQSAPDIAFYNYFKKAAETRGIEWRKEWLTECEFTRAHQAEEKGYEAFRRLWKRKRRPEGLIVFPDMVARGVLIGVMSLHVDVPRELKLVLHRNREVGLVSSVPVTFMDVCVNEVAKDLIDMVERQFAGKPIEPVLFKFHPTPGGGGQTRDR